MQGVIEGKDWVLVSGVKYGLEPARLVSLLYVAGSNEFVLEGEVWVRSQHVQWDCELLTGPFEGVRFLITPAASAKVIIHYDESKKISSFSLHRSMVRVRNVIGELVEGKFLGGPLQDARVSFELSQLLIVLKRSGMSDVEISERHLAMVRGRAA